VLSPGCFARDTLDLCMRPWPRLRKTAKWAVTVLGLFTALAYFASQEWPFEFRRTWRGATRDHEVRIIADLGTVALLRVDQPPGPARISESRLALVASGDPMLPGVRSVRSLVAMSGGVVVRSRRLVSLWVPVAVLAASTVLLWRVDLVEAMRARVGRCAKCGYSRAGLRPDAPCPECGSAAPTK
jgi:hypothetical protein